MQALRPTARLYIAAVIGAAAVLLILAVLTAFGVLPMVGSLDRSEMVLAVVVLAPAYVLAYSLTSPLRMPVELVVTSPILLASGLIAGPYGAVMVAASGVFAVTTVAWVKRAFNHAQFVLVGFGAAVVYQGLGGPLADAFDQEPFGFNVLLPLAAAIVTAMVINGVLIVGVLRLAEGISARAVWRGVIASSAVPYSGYGLFGLLMAVLWSVGGGFAAVLVLIPLLVARWAYQQYAEQQEAYEATIRSLVQAVETKDHYTRGHSERVSRASVMIARILAMREDRVDALRYAGILHDVGKLGVPTRVLQKTGPLTDLEYAAIQLHPVRGTEMVRGIAFLEEAYEGILHHHERLDGLGYPSGLKGQAIPEFARIIAVADAFDSMTSTRSYRNARTVEQAVVELERCQGTQFDAAMVQALVFALEGEPWRTNAFDPGAPQPGADLRDREAAPSGGFDHDDPTVPRPTGHDPRAAAAAEAAERAEIAALRRQDDA